MQMPCMKFDAIIGNPPYQAKTVSTDGCARSRHGIWPDMVVAWHGRVEHGGMLSLVHPANWRGTGKTITNVAAHVRKLLRSMDMAWLSMHDIGDGIRTFGASTRFDCYVAFKSDTPGFETEIRDGRGAMCMKCIKEMDFIPNWDGGVMDIMASEGEEPVDFMYDARMYHSDDRLADGMVSMEMTDECRLPCVHSVSSVNGAIRFIYAREDQGHFGVPKVIFSIWHNPGVPIADAEGKYGMSEQVAAFADDPENLPLIKKAMETPEFLDMMKSVQFNSRAWNWKVMRKFRKDFWKEFI